jgi:hypothetical protein
MRRSGRTAMAGPEGLMQPDVMISYSQLSVVGA